MNTTAALLALVTAVVTAAVMVTAIPAPPTAAAWASMLVGGGCGVLAYAVVDSWGDGGA